MERLGRFGLAALVTGFLLLGVGATATAAPMSANISAPLENSRAMGVLTVTGTADDTDLANWTLAYKTDSGDTWTVINSGTEVVNDELLGSFDTTSVADGWYDIRLRIENTTGGSAFETNRFRIDNTPPSISFTQYTPADGATVAGAFNLHGILSDNDELTWDVHYSPAGTDNWTALSSPGVWYNMIYGNFHFLDTTKIPNGTHDLRVTAVDRVGNSVEAVRSGWMVNNPPLEIALTVIENPTTTPYQQGVLYGPVPMKGPARGEGLNEWHLEYSPTGENLWAPLLSTEAGNPPCAGSLPIGDYPNFEFCTTETTLLADGTYDFRLTVTDIWGEAHVQTETFPVDNRAMLPPASITFQESMSGLRVLWDLTGPISGGPRHMYNLYRNDQLLSWGRAGSVESDGFAFYADGSAEIGVEYSYHITVARPGSTAVQSDAFTFTRSSLVPTASTLQLDPYTAFNSVALKWDQPDGLHGGQFHVYRDGDQIGTVGIQYRYWNDNGLPVGSYTYQVITTAAWGTSAESNEVVVTTSDPPPAPGEIQLTVTPGDGELTLSWEHPSGMSNANWDGYDIILDEDYIDWVDYPADTYTITGLSNGTTYVVQLGACNFTDCAESEEVTLSPGIPPEPPPPVIQEPSVSQPLSPSVHLGSPAGGAVLKGVVPVEISATGGEAYILLQSADLQLVEIPHDWDTTKWPDGPYWLKAIASGAGGTAMDAVQITVDNTPPRPAESPRLSIPSEIRAGLPVRLAVSLEVVDAHPGATQLRLMEGDELLASTTDLDPQGELELDVTFAKAGSYRLQLQLKDAVGNETDLPLASIDVLEPAADPQMPTPKPPADPQMPTLKPAADPQPLTLEPGADSQISTQKPAADSQMPPVAHPPQEVARRDLYMMVQGRMVAGDAPAFTEKGQTWLPIRFVVEALGGVVKWDPTLRAVQILGLDETILQLLVGQTILVIHEGGETRVVQLDHAPFIEKDRIYVSNGFVVEKLGYEVQWQNDFTLVIN